MPRHIRLPRRALVVLLLSTLTLVCLSGAVLTPSATHAAAATAQPTGTATAAGLETADTKLACAYTGNSLTELQQFGWLVGRQPDCAMVFNDSTTTWAAWEDPWFGHMPLDQPQYAWPKWLAAGSRTLVISQSLVPDGVDAGTWRARGAAGAYDDHIRTLGHNLVAYGMGDTIIRLSHEANGDWSFDWIGATAQDHADWRAFWAHFVSVMRSVPGGSFEFDWTVNPAWPRVPFDDYYPGDAAVDVIGVDQYDAAPATAGVAQPGRWTYQRDVALGLSPLVSFAAAHGKPLSIPEWGLVPPTLPEGAGDDAYFADQLAAVVRANPVRYQSYFNVTGTKTMRLQDLPGARAAWKRHYGAGGDSFKQTPATTTTPPPPPTYPPVAPALNTRAACLDEGGSRAALLSFGWLVGRELDCAVVHNEGPATWAAWRDPWTTRTSAAPDFQWSSWLTSGAGRRTLVLAQSLVPAEAPADWRTRGASGEYDDQIRALGSTLMSRGFGDIVIRLAQKPNGTWQKDSAGTSDADFGAWRAYWARAATLLRATPGSSFELEWSLNAGYRALPLDQIYPGDAAVDIVGISQYDSGPATIGTRQPDRWSYQAALAGGLNQVVAFARTHAKPLAVSEWAVLPTTRTDGVGDDAFFADQVAALVRSVPTRYQAYVNSTSTGVLRMQDAAGTRASWKRHYGVGGDSVGAATG